MNRGKVGEEREGKEMDGCPLTMMGWSGSEPKSNLNQGCALSLLHSHIMHGSLRDTVDHIPSICLILLSSDGMVQVLIQH
jgi:hypothetical protein